MNRSSSDVHVLSGPEHDPWIAIGVVASTSEGGRCETCCWAPNLVHKSLCPPQGMGKAKASVVVNMGGSPVCFGVLLLRLRRADVTAVTSVTLVLDVALLPVQGGLSRS